MDLLLWLALLAPVPSPAMTSLPSYPVCAQNRDYAKYLEQWCHDLSYVHWRQGDVDASWTAWGGRQQQVELTYYWSLAANVTNPQAPWPVRQTSLRLLVERLGWPAVIQGIPGPAGEWIPIKH